MSKFVILHNFVFKARNQAKYLSSFIYGQMAPCFVQTKKYAHLSKMQDRKEQSTQIGKEYLVSCISYLVSFFAAYSYSIIIP